MNTAMSCKKAGWLFDGDRMANPTYTSVSVIELRRWENSFKGVWQCKKTTSRQMKSMKEE